MESGDDEFSLLRSMECAGEDESSAARTEIKAIKLCLIVVNKE